MDLTNIRLKLGIQDESEDELLAVLLTDAMNYMLVYLGKAEIPKELEFIAEEVAIKRYRRIGSEGITVEKIDVLSTTYETNDFAEYLPLMTHYRKKSSGAGGFKFF